MVVYYGCKGRIREVRYAKLIISKHCTVFKCIIYKCMKSFIENHFNYQVTKPTSDWGPGDKNAKHEWITYKQNKAMEAMTCKRHPHAAAAAYDNYAMNYPVGYYAAPSYHM